MCMWKYEENLWSTWSLNFIIYGRMINIKRRVLWCWCSLIVDGERDWWWWWMRALDDPLRRDKNTNKFMLMTDAQELSSGRNIAWDTQCHVVGNDGDQFWVETCSLYHPVTGKKLELKYFVEEWWDDDYIQSACKLLLLPRRNSKCNLMITRRQLSIKQAILFGRT